MLSRWQAHGCKLRGFLCDITGEIVYEGYRLWNWVYIYYLERDVSATVIYPLVSWDALTERRNQPSKGEGPLPNWVGQCGNPQTRLTENPTRDMTLYSRFQYCLKGAKTCVLKSTTWHLFPLPPFAAGSYCRRHLMVLTKPTVSITQYKRTQKVHSLKTMLLFLCSTLA